MKKILLFIYVILITNIFAEKNKSIELANEYIKVTKLQVVFEDTINTLIIQTINNNPNINQEEVTKYYNKVMSWEVVKDTIIKTTNEAFTDDELKEIIRFLKTPIGQTYSNKSPWISSEITKTLLKKVDSIQKTTLDKLDKELNTIVNNLNKNLPMMIDSETRADSTLALNKHFITKYTLINYNQEQINSTELKKTLLEPLTNTVCTGDSMKFFRDNNVTCQYIYYGNKGKKITTITIEPFKCK